MPNVRARFRMRSLSSEVSIELKPAPGSSRRRMAGLVATDRAMATSRRLP